ncbi:MAG TPA: LPXTG cell wall anchor domain-containing protein, partial [Methylotenera sp.]|nr:LPXTG cell wall anchor domain-containing protein [Methylotenera sp.]
LRQPSQDTLNAISRREAAGEIKVQTANWNAYRNKLAGIVADAAPTDSEASTQSAGGKIKSAEDKSEAVSSGPKDVVKLSAGEAGASASAEDIKSLQAKITALQEEATAREKSVKEAQDRTADLEKQIADMQKLLAMKNDTMADIQKQAANEASKPAEVVPTPVDAAKPAEETAPAETAKAEAVAPVENKPKPVITSAEIAPAEEPSFFATLLDGLNFNLLAPAAGLLALLAGGWLYLRKKREKNLADFEQGIMTSGGLKANTVFGNTASASVDTGDTSFLTDFSQSANGGMIDTNDVDPIAEAEVYMAYGRDAQAEEILKDAISKEPKRHELHLKLLEMYAASKNLSAFETIAGELYTSLGAEDPMWAKVAEIGFKLEPNNPLYQPNSAPTGIAGNLDASDFANTP